MPFLPPLCTIILFPPNFYLKYIPFLSLILFYNYLSFYLLSLLNYDFPLFIIFSLLFIFFFLFYYSHVCVKKNQKCKIKDYQISATILLCISFIASSVSVCALLRSRSDSWFIGTRCKCAWGTSIPKTKEPILTHQVAFFNACAIFCAVWWTAVKYGSGSSYSSLTSTFGTTSVWPSCNGLISRNANVNSSS